MVGEYQFKNQGRIRGSVGKDPKIMQGKDAMNPKKFASFSVATSYVQKDAKDGAEQVRKTTWHNVFVVGIKDVEFVENNIRRGMFVDVTGYMETTSYTDKDGRDVKNFQIFVDWARGGEIFIIDSHKFIKTPKVVVQRKEVEDFSVPYGIDDDIPF